MNYTNDKHGVVLSLCFCFSLGHGVAKMTSHNESFDFEFFESMKVNQAKAAREFLLEKYPIGSDAKAASAYIAARGAKCQFAHDKEWYYYYCSYIRPGHGLMGLVSSIEWKVIFLTDPSGISITNISVGREATGP